MTTTDRYLETRLRDANLFVDANRLHESFARAYGPFLPADRGARILDLGCGSGDFLDYLAGAGYASRLGIDVSRDCVVAAGERHAVRHVTDVPGFLRETAGEWDAVVMRHVIAHVPKADTVPLLVAVYGGLRAGGPLLVETFNAALPTACYTWANDFTHEQAFTEESLRQVLRMAGFARVEVCGLEPRLRGARGRAYAIARALHVRWLRLALTLERGAGNNPTLFSKFLLAVAVKGR